MLKKVYSMRSMHHQHHHRQGNHEDQTMCDDLDDTLKTRQVFRYTWRERFRANLWKSWYCYLCRGCLTHKARKRNILFKQGLGRLYTEIDLLEVVKQLRISRFMSSIFLTKTQRELVKFQHSYMLSLHRPKRKVVRSASTLRSTDHETIHQNSNNHN